MRKSIKKQLIAWILVLTLVMASACTGSESDDGNKGTPTVTETVTPKVTEEPTKGIEEATPVPTEAEILRIKGALILKRNATRDYLDFAALSYHIGLKATLDALMCFDDLYPQKNGQSALQQLYLQLDNPHPFDLDGIELSIYKHLTSDWQSWENVAQQCQRIACGIFAAMKKTGEPDNACSPAPGH